MPNWIEGTMKVRGKAEDLIRFFENGFDAPVKKEEFDDASVLYTIEPMVYINGSRRDFTGFGRDYEIRSYIGSVQTVPVPIKQAWSFTPYEGAEQRWIDLSKKYNLDIRLQDLIASDADAWVKDVDLRKPARIIRRLQIIIRCKLIFCK